MNLVFDARLMAAQFSGLGRYTGSLLDVLLTSYTNPSFEITILLHSQHQWSENFYFSALANHLKDSRCLIEYVDVPPISLRQHLAVQATVNRIRPIHYFYPHFDLPLGIQAKTTFVIHDFIPLIVTGYVRRYAWVKQQYFKQMIKFGVRRAARCIAVSKTTRQDILSLVGNCYAEKIDVVYEGSMLAQSDSTPLFLGDLGVQKPFLLYVGDRRPHKHLQRVLELFIKLREVYGYQGSLVLAGSTKNFELDIDKLIQDRHDIHVLGNVSDSQLISLYRATDALVFLSEYEGFGLPVVEAARFSRKMILSDGGALAEIAPSNACILNRAMPINEAAHKAAGYLQENLQVDYTEFNACFSWEKAARAIFPEAYA